MDIFGQFLDLMEERGFDFHSAFRNLYAFSSSYIQDNDKKFDGFISYRCSRPRPERFNESKVSADLKARLVKYSDRISEERTRKKMGPIRGSCCGCGR